MRRPGPSIANRREVMPADREERYIRAWIDSLRRAVTSGISTADLGRLASAALGDDEAEVGDPIAMGEPGEKPERASLELTRR
jgi:hypothetical protein